MSCESPLLSRVRVESDALGVTGVPSVSPLAERASVKNWSNEKPPSAGGGPSGAPRNTRSSESSLLAARVGLPCGSVRPNAVASVCAAASARGVAELSGNRSSSERGVARGSGVGSGVGVANGIASGAGLSNATGDGACGSANGSAMPLTSLGAEPAAGGVGS